MAERRRIALTDDLTGGLRAIVTEALALAALVSLAVVVALVVDLVI